MRGLLKLGRAGLATSRHASTALARTTAEALEARPSAFITQLDSGLRVASLRTGARTGTLGFYVEGGARFETLDNYGSANLLQHVLFQGSSESAAKSGVRVSVEADREVVSYSAQCLASEVEAAAAVLGKALAGSNISEATVDGAKALILRQIQAQDHEYREFTMDLLHKAAFQGTPLENGLFGLTDSLEGLRGMDVQDFHQNYYLAPRAVIVGVGPWDHGDLVRLVQKHFAGLPSKATNQKAYEGPVRFTSALLSYEDDTYPACYQAVGMEGLPFGHPDSKVMDVVAAITGSFDRSKDLFGGSPFPYLNHLHYLENDRHPYRTYLFDFFNIQYKEAGMFGGYWMVDELGYMPENVLKGFLKEHLVRMAHGATKNEVGFGVELAKTRLLAEDTARGSDHTAASIGREVLYTGDRKPLSERIAALDTVTPAEVQRVLQDLVWDKVTAFSAVGQIEAAAESVDGSGHGGPNGWTSRYFA